MIVTILTLDRNKFWTLNFELAESFYCLLWPSSRHKSSSRKLILVYQNGNLVLVLHSRKLIWEKESFDCLQLQNHIVIINSYLFDYVKKLLESSILIDIYINLKINLSLHFYFYFYCSNVYDLFDSFCTIVWK